jgi:ornithine carbamoyltransferase
MDIACPTHSGYAPIQSVLDEANKIGATTGSKFRVLQDVAEAAKDSDIVSFLSSLSLKISLPPLLATVRK